MEIQWSGQLHCQTKAELSQTYATAEEAIAALETLIVPSKYITDGKFTSQTSYANGKIISVYGTNIYGVVKQVQYPCPIPVVGSDQSEFWVDTEFLVYFADAALRLMTLGQIYDICPNSDKSLQAWPIPKNWVKPPYLDIGGAAVAVGCEDEPHYTKAIWFEGKTVHAAKGDSDSITRCGYVLWGTPRSSWHQEITCKNCLRSLEKEEK